MSSSSADAGPSNVRRCNSSSAAANIASNCVRALREAVTDLSGDVLARVSSYAEAAHTSEGASYTPI